MKNIVLDSRQFWEEFSKSFGSSKTGDSFWYILLICLGAVLLLLVGGRALRRFLVDREGARLFNELCAAHKLDKKQRRFLVAYSEALGLHDRCLLFVKRSLFNKSLAGLTKERGLMSHLSLRPKSFRAIRDKLKTVLFAEADSNGTFCRQTDNPDKEAQELRRGGH